MGVDSDAAVVRVSLARLAVVTVSLPLGAFCLCIYLSLKNNFDLSTATHCGVPNYLPSISSAIGEFVPQRYIWRIAIAVHSAPRFLLASMYRNFMKRVLPNIPFYRGAVRVTTLLNVVENVALLGLSFVSSKENYDVHKVSFIVFMVCSELYMLLTCILLKDNTSRLSVPLERFAFTRKILLKLHQNRLNVARIKLKRRLGNEGVKDNTSRLSVPLERFAFTRKKQLMTANMMCFFVALYFFYRHNKYCEPGMYSVFAFLEYLVVLTNMGFHMTAYYDFHHHDLVVGEWKTSSS